MLKKIARAGFAERRFDTGEVTLRYVEGPASGPPLVLIPAQMGIWESYHRVMPALAQRFHVFVLEIRGHGGSSWTTGDYSWGSVGRDVRAFLQGVVRAPALIAGNSSGGVIALWCAANVPALTAGIVIEDAPLFSAEWPRFRDRDRFVYNGLKHLVEHIGDVHDRDLADYFRGLSMPLPSGRLKRIPDWFVNWLSRRLKNWQRRHPGQPIDVRWFPDLLRVLMKSLSCFDPDFARAFVDGRFYGGMDHADAFRRARCPILLLHATWYRLPQWGLIGAMDDDDAQHARRLAPHLVYRKIEAKHVIHAFEPKAYLREVVAFGDVVFGGQ